MKAAMMVWDGLRPEFVRPDLTPTLCSLSDRGVVFENHQAMFPTETRVNSSSLATGSTPDLHGMIANRFWDRELECFVNTGDHEDLDRIRTAKGSVLGVPTLCGRLQEAGFRTLVVGAGSPGSTLLQAPDTPGPVINTRGVVQPDSLTGDIVDRFGAFPTEEEAPDGWNDLACRIFSEETSSGSYDFGVLWLCDPDYTQHKQGLGSLDSLASIRANDARLAELLGVFPEDVNLFVSSDHGFSTVDRARKASPGWLAMEEDRAWSGSSGIYLADPERDLEQTVHEASEQPWMGPMFTKDCGDGKLGVVEGTFSRGLLNLEHATRSPDLIYSRKWTTETNDYGVPGGVWGPGGIATHGSLSPFDRRCVLIGSGASFREGIRSATPSRAVDVAPTILSLFDLDAELSGRVLSESLSASGDISDVTEQSQVFAGRWRMTFLHLDGRPYLESIEG